MAAARASATTPRRLATGTPGVLHGTYTMLLQDQEGQIQETHSVSAGLDYPGVGPEHALLREIGRVQYIMALDDDALDCVQECSTHEGLLPAIESRACAGRRARLGEAQPGQAHARRSLGPRRQGHADAAEDAAREAGVRAMSATTGTPAQRLSAAIREARRERVALVAFMTAGFPSKERFRADLAAVAAEADVVEIGVPFTDPLADGVTIQRSSLAALAQGVSLHWILDELAAMPKREGAAGADGLPEPDARVRPAGARCARGAGRRRRLHRAGPADRGERSRSSTR